MLKGGRKQEIINFYKGSAKKRFSGKKYLKTFDNTKRREERKIMKEKGLIFIISAPSGTGKTTVIKKFLKHHKHDFVLSVSVTTRCPRKNEKNGRDYYFISLKKFKEHIKKRKFLEYAKVLDNYYGTLKETVFKAIKKGLNVIMDIDVQGAAKIKRQIKDSITIFLKPPSLKELKKRLLKRKTESKQEALKRLNLAKKELKEQGKYDYILTNKNINDVVKILDAIYSYEKFKRKYMICPGGKNG